MAEQAREGIGANLARAREGAGFSQDEVALLLNQPRPVISAWETDARRPSARDLQRLANIYRTTIDGLLRASMADRSQLERLLFRDASGRLDARGKYELQRFLGFLDAYAELLEVVGEPPGMTHSPFNVREGFYSKLDIRRHAKAARDFLGIGEGPVGDLAAAADVKGITVYFAPLGGDLSHTVSGAFVPHGGVGFSIIVNNQTTPGRRQFTLAHELGHALFQGNHHYVGYFGRREAAERFANMFASEFLVPAGALRAAVESLGLSRVAEPDAAVYLQRYFRVSYEMLLVRLRAANLSSEDDILALRQVRPVRLAEAMGYDVDDDERVQDQDSWGLARFPGRFLRLLRRALRESAISVSRAADITGLAAEDIEQFISDETPSPAASEEFEYIAASG